MPMNSIVCFGAASGEGCDLSYDRAEAARILLTTSSHSGMDPVDRGYLAKLVAADTGTAAPDAERRVDEVAARAKQDIGRARSSAVILAFMAGAAALLGAIRLDGRSHRGSYATDAKPFLPYGIGAEHPKFGVRDPQRQGKSAKPLIQRRPVRGRDQLFCSWRRSWSSTPFLW